MFCTQSFSIRFKRNGAQKLAHSFGCLLVKKEERQNSNCGVNFSQRFKRKGALFCRSERSVPSIIILCKIWRTNNISGHPIFTKMSQENVSVLRRTVTRSLLLFCEKCEVPKNVRIYDSSFQFLWVLQMTNARLIQTRLLKCFSREMYKRHFKGQTLIQTSK